MIDTNCKSYTKEQFRKRAIDYYLNRGRAFPWRSTNDAYVVLVTELLLQKTTAKQVLGVYNKFFSTYQTIADLAKANIEELETIVGRLGLTKRSRFLKELADKLVEEYDGRMPECLDDLLSLKGVGQYTANAVLIFAYGESRPLVDSNIARVLRRCFKLKGEKPAYADRDIWKFAESLAAKDNCREYSYGLLDLAALLCHAKKPNCQNCPLGKNDLPPIVAPPIELESRPF